MTRLAGANHPASPLAPLTHGLLTHGKKRCFQAWTAAGFGAKGGNNPR
jgi:hypothetical protein